MDANAATLYIDLLKRMVTRYGFSEGVLREATFDRMKWFRPIQGSLRNKGLYLARPEAFDADAREFGLDVRGWAFFGQWDFGFFRPLGFVRAIPTLLHSGYDIQSRNEVGFGCIEVRCSEICPFEHAHGSGIGYDRRVHSSGSR